jgi:uroporphyrinogen III methyltransferase / synthase
MCRLSGLRIVVTRASHQAEELAAPLRTLGADVLLVPVIDIAPPLDPTPLRQAVARCDEYDWIIFSSANAVNAFSAELAEPRACRARIAAVGAATREVAQQNGLAVEIVPEKYVAESLIEALRSESLAGKRILIPSAAVTRDVIPGALRKLGAHVDVVEAYRNVTPAGAAERAAEVFREPLPDWVTFASSSAVENTVRLVGAESLQRIKIATIGPVTSQSAEKNGLWVAAEANPHNVEGLVDAICKAGFCIAEG